jgi:hypothetical protein
MTIEKTLPPLILHPFADAAGPDKLVESSRASLMLQGLLPTGERSAEELDRALLDGRYCEIRMLYYVGKDLVRWIEQCLEHIERDPSLAGRGIRYQSFAAYLVNHTPLPVQAKLRKWGVADYRSIFTRALGLNAVLADAPRRSLLSEEFVRNYYRYADQMFTCHQGQAPFTEISDFGFDFEIFASGEYSRMLEREWEEAPADASADRWTDANERE